MAGECSFFFNPFDDSVLHVVIRSPLRFLTTLRSHPGMARKTSRVRQLSRDATQFQGLFPSTPFCLFLRDGVPGLSFLGFQRSSVAAVDGPRLTHPVYVSFFVTACLCMVRPFPTRPRERFKITSKEGSSSSWTAGMRRRNVGLCRARLVPFTVPDP